jgi:GNAT superfamily N-acetyltransferase
MPKSIEESIEAAELAVFARKKLSLRAASDAGLPGRFESFSTGGLRASMATANQYDFLNTIEGVTELSAEALPDVIKRFPDPCRITIVTTWPSQNLTERLRGQGYEPAPVRPIAFLRLSPDFSRAQMGATPWRIREVFTQEEMTVFMDLLDGGYAASSEVGALIRAEHALPAIRGFVASRNEQPLAAAALSVHTTGAVLGGTATLPAARGTGAQTALLAYRLSFAADLGISLATATAAPGSPSISNLSKLGFTIVERTAWRFANGCTREGRCD